MLDELYNVTKRNHPIDEDPEVTQAQSYLGRTDVENYGVEDGITQKRFSRDGSAARFREHSDTIACGSRRSINTWMIEARCMDCLQQVPVPKLIGTRLLHVIRQKCPNLKTKS